MPLIACGSFVRLITISLLQYGKVNGGIQFMLGLGGIKLTHYLASYNLKDRTPQKNGLRNKREILHLGQSQSQRSYVDPTLDIINKD